MGKKKCRIRQIFDNHVTVGSKGSTINRFKDFLRKRYFEFFFFFFEFLTLATFRTERIEIRG